MPLPLRPTHTHTSGDTSSCHNWEGSLLLASSGWGRVAEMLLNVVWCTGQPPATHRQPRMIQLKMPTVPGLKKSPWRKEFPDLWILFTSSEKPASGQTKGRVDFSPSWLKRDSKGHRLPGIPDKTPNLWAGIFKDHNFRVRGETAQECWSVLFFLSHSTIPPIISWVVLKMDWKVCPELRF